MLRLNLTVALALWLLAAFGQTDAERKKTDRAYESFKQTFDYEFEDSKPAKDEDQTSEQPVVYYPPVNLPEWFFDYGHGSRMIGISDPGMDSLTALNQARLRAIALLALSHSYRIETVMDNYYIEKGGARTLGKFNVFTTISSALPANDEGFETIASFFAPTGEVIVLVEMQDISSSSDTCDRIECTIGNFESEQTLTRHPVYMRRVAMDMEINQCRGVKTTANWVQSESMGRYDILSELDSMNIAPVRGTFKYLTPESYHQKLPEAAFQEFFNLDKGLWSGYISALINNLEKMEIFNSQIKNLDETYHRQYQGLTRVIFSFESSFRVKQTYIMDNQLLMGFE
jgi:hypothetical protein